MKPVFVAHIFIVKTLFIYETTENSYEELCH